MEDLRLNMPESVANIRKLQTSLSRHSLPDLCAIGCEDLDIVRGFISSIDKLEELSVINYEPDASAIWPSIFQHGNSLRSLAIHTPPQRPTLVWTPTTTSEAIEALPHLTRLELDIGLEEAESLLSPTDSGQQQTESVVSELAKAQRLESVLINVNLPDAANVFAGAHTWNAYGPTSFGEDHKEPREQLALKLFEKLEMNESGISSLKHLELRFPRRFYEDRAQFWTIASSVHVRKNEAGVIELEAQTDLQEYLPPWPKWGGHLWNLMRVETPWTM